MAKKKTAKKPARPQRPARRVLKFNGRALLDLREKHDVHRLELAASVSDFTGQRTMSRQTVMIWEKSQADPSGKSIAALCSIFDVTPSVFYHRVEE